MLPVRLGSKFLDAYADRLLISDDRQFRRFHDEFQLFDCGDVYPSIETSYSVYFVRVSV